jgi:hypothetical protein
MTLLLALEAGRGGDALIERATAHLVTWNAATETVVSHAIVFDRKKGGQYQVRAQRSLNEASMFPEWAREWARCLVLLTLVLGTRVGKLYSASTLVLSLSASCSWDRSSRASAQLALNLP